MATASWWGFWGKSLGQQALQPVTWDEITTRSRDRPKTKPFLWQTVSRHGSDAGSVQPGIKSVGQ